MQKSVSEPDKILRIVLFSVYLAFIVFFVFLFFKGLKFSLIVFYVSTAYFVIVFLFLAITRNLHFNILLSRKDIRRTLFSSNFPLTKSMFFKAISWVAIGCLAVMTGFYFYFGLWVHATVLLVIALFAYFYFNHHKIGIHVISEGIAFDYGEIIVLLQWSEIKKITVKGNSVVAELKEKRIKRKFYVNNPEEFRKIVKKFGF